MAATDTNTAAVEKLSVSAYTIPIDSLESDGTLAWDSTTIIVIEVFGGGEKSLGYTYDIYYFRRMLEAGAVDVLHADATRCAGITGFCKLLPRAGHAACNSLESRDSYRKSGFWARMRQCLGARYSLRSFGSVEQTGAVSLVA